MSQQIRIGVQAVGLVMSVGIRVWSESTQD
jgi:hypothetical protein